MAVSFAGPNAKTRLGWTDYAFTSWNLHVPDAALVRVFLGYIEVQRKKKGIRNPKRGETIETVGLQTPPAEMQAVESAIAGVSNLIDEALPE